MSDLSEIKFAQVTKLSDLLEIEFAQIEHALYLMTLVGNDLAGQSDKRELYYEMLSKVDRLQIRAFELRALMARDVPVSSVVTTLTSLGIVVDKDLFNRLEIERRELASLANDAPSKS